MILGDCYVGWIFFVFYCVSQQWYQSDLWVDAWLGLDHMLIWGIDFLVCFPVMWSFLCLTAWWGFATRIDFSHDPSMLLLSMLVALIMDYIKFLGSHRSLAIENLTWTGLWILWIQIHTGSRVERILACGISCYTQPYVKLATLKFHFFLYREHRLPVTC